MDCGGTVDEPATQRRSSELVLERAGTTGIDRAFSVVRYVLSVTISTGRRLVGLAGGYSVRPGATLNGTRTVV